MKNFILALALCLSFTSFAHADLIFQDNFDSYSDGSIAGQGGWEVHSGAGGGTVTVDTGVACLGHGSGAREDVNRDFASFTTGVISYSMDVVVTDNTSVSGSDFEYFAHFGSGGGSSVSNFVAQLDVVASAGNDFTFGIATDGGSADATLTTGFAFGDTVSLLVEYDLDNGVASLTVGAETVTGDTGGNSNVGAFALRQSDSSADETIKIDRLSVDHVAAVPEPTSAIAFGLAGLCLCVVRRRS